MVIIIPNLRNNHLQGITLTYDDRFIENCRPWPGAHLNQWICEQKEQLSRHTGALWRLQNKPCHLLRQVTGVMVNPVWLGASISLSHGKRLFLRCLKSQWRWKQGIYFSLYEFHPNNSRAHVLLEKSHCKCSLCAGMS